MVFGVESAHTAAIKAVLFFYRHTFLPLPPRLHYVTEGRAGESGWTRGYHWSRLSRQITIIACEGQKQSLHQFPIKRSNPEGIVSESAFDCQLPHVKLVHSGGPEPEFVQPGGKLGGSRAYLKSTIFALL